MTRTDAHDGKAAAHKGSRPTVRLINLAGTWFLTAFDDCGRQCSSVCELSDLLTPELAARRIERATGVRPELPDAGRWARFVAFASVHGGPAE